MNNQDQNYNVNVIDKKNLFNSSVFTRERSMQFLTQLWVKREKNNNKKTLLRQHTRTLLPVAMGPFMSLLLSS